VTQTIFRRFGRAVAGGLLLAASTTGTAAPVTFGDSLYARFQHPRCLSCHQFNSRHHNGRAFGSHLNRYVCKQCHQPGLIGLAPDSDWQAPLNMDYTGLSAADTCRLIKQRIGFDPDGRKLAGHLLNDARIRWGLESGMTPNGKKPTVPGGVAQWSLEVEAWVRDGMRCE
jgi:hypothetical protein